MQISVIKPPLFLCSTKYTCQNMYSFKEEIFIFLHIHFLFFAQNLAFLIVLALCFLFQTSSTLIFISYIFSYSHSLSSLFTSSNILAIHSLGKWMLLLAVFQFHQVSHSFLLSYSWDGKWTGFYRPDLTQSPDTDLLSHGSFPPFNLSFKPAILY